MHAKSIFGGFPTLAFGRFYIVTFSKWKLGVGRGKWETKHGSCDFIYMNLGRILLLFGSGRYGLFSLMMSLALGASIRDL
jgi:hypothetical protein